MQPVFSVIIPYKNTKDYIEECLKSIAEQTYTDFEVLCINDSSEDGTGDIVRNFIQKDKRFKNINIETEEKGPGGARNLGIDNAQGKYLVFVDSDDWCSSKLLQKLYNSYEKEPDADSIWYNSYECHRDSATLLKKWVTKGVLEITPQNIFDYPEYVWIKSFKTDFIKNNNIRYMSNVYFEDDYFYFDMAFRNPKIYCINDALYYYRRHDSSITGHSQSLYKRNSHFFKVMHNVYKSIAENNYDSAWKKAVRDYTMGYVAQYKIQVNPFLGAEYQKFINNVDKLDKQADN